MSSNTIPNDSTTQAPGWMVPAIQATSALLAIGLVFQAFLGSSGFLQNKPDLVTVHEMVGNLAFLIAVAQVVIAFVGMQKGTLSRNIVMSSALVVILVVAQLGLGYSGRESLDARVWHIANGVLLMGACTWTAALAFTATRRTSA
jgi:hypothetical protein